MDALWQAIYPRHISKYICTAIEIYRKRDKHEVLQSITLIYSLNMYKSQLEPKIFITYKNSVTYVDYEQLRHGHFIKGCTEAQKECVKAAEFCYYELRDAVVNETDLHIVFQEINRLVSIHFNAPVQYQLE